MILKFRVYEQTISLQSTKSEPRQGSKDYLELQFSFSSDWNDLLKYVYIQHGEVSVPHDLVEESIIVDEYFTEQTEFNVTLFGKSADGSVEVPTNVITVFLKESNNLWVKDAPEPQNSWFVQVVDARDEALAAAIRAENAAIHQPYINSETETWWVWDISAGAYQDTGKSSRGDPGPQGPKGDTGADGQPGADGQDGVTPTIGDNGNWYLGDTDTGKPSRGEMGPAGIGVPDGGTEGQFLGKTGDGPAWVDIPESGLPSGGAPYQQLVTDSTGAAKWEDRLAYREELVSVDLVEGTVFYKVSSKIPDGITDGFTATLWFSDGHSATGNVTKFGDNIYGVGEGGLVVITTADNYVFHGTTFPEKGIYFIYVPAESTGEVGMYVCGLAFGEATEPEITWDGKAFSGKLLDANLLPNGYARPTDITLYSNSVDCSNNSSAPYQSDYLDCDFFFESGKKYTVTFDGVEYTDIPCGINDTAWYVGFPPSAPDSSDLPFSVIVEYHNYGIYRYVMSKGSGTHNIIIEEQSDGVISTSILPNKVLVLRANTGMTEITYSNMSPEEVFSAIMTNELSHAILSCTDSVGREERYYSVVVDGAHSNSFAILFLNYYDMNDNTSQIEGGYEVWGRYSDGAFGIQKLPFDNLYAKGMILKSSTRGSTKKFRITVDDSGAITATEVV